MDKLDEASDALKQKLYEKVKVALESGTELVSKRVKGIKLADESEYGWVTVNEYLSDELASDFDDEKRIYRAERRAGRKTNKEKRRRVRSDEKGSGSSSVAALSAACGNPSISALFFGPFCMTALLSSGLLLRECLSFLV